MVQEKKLAPMWTNHTTQMELYDENWFSINFVGHTYITNISEHYFITTRILRTHRDFRFGIKRSKITVCLTNERTMQCKFHLCFMKFEQLKYCHLIKFVSRYKSVNSRVKIAAVTMPLSQNEISSVYMYKFDAVQCLFVNFSLIVATIKLYASRYVSWCLCNSC